MNDAGDPKAPVQQWQPKSALPANRSRRRRNRAHHHRAAGARPRPAPLVVGPKAAATEER